MPLYTYRATTREGQIQEGSVEAVNEQIAESALRQQDLSVVSLEVGPKAAFGNISLDFLNPITAKDKMLFFRQLSTMIEATLPIVQSLRILSSQTRNPNLHRVIEQISHDVEGGSSLSNSLAQFPNIFPQFHIGLIRAGETTGKLDQTLVYLANQLESDYDLISKVRGAMVYPAIVLMGLVIVGALMMVMVIPQLTAILEETGGDLPWTTRALIKTSGAMHDYWWVFVMIIIGAAGFLFWFRRQPAGKAILDLLKIKVPVVGLVYKQLYLVRFTRNLSTLLSGGVPIGEALRVVGGVLGNALYRDAVLRVQQGVESGESLAQIFQREPIFPPIVAQMASVGERTGRLVDVLEKLAKFYHRELDVAMKGMFAAIEPMLMIVLGVAVGVMVAAILMPIYNLASAM